MSSLTPTARVILGMLKLGVRTGYDVKKAIDTSTRFFWTASYGQIYPELKRLREAGLVRAKEEPRGRVKRTVYSLTPKGERALNEWLKDSTDDHFVVRDEGLLRLFFGDVLSHEEVVANLRMQVMLFEMTLAQLQLIEVDARDGFVDEGQRHPYLALRYGIDFVTWARDWFADLERRLEAGDPLVELEDGEAGGRERRLAPS
jgi:DNA-binding PadR family transcriptional regulator